METRKCNIVSYGNRAGWWSKGKRALLRNFRTLSPVRKVKLAEFKGTIRAEYSMVLMSMMPSAGWWPYARFETTDKSSRRGLRLAPQKRRSHPIARAVSKSDTPDDLFNRAGYRTPRMAKPLAEDAAGPHGDEMGA